MPIYTVRSRYSVVELGDFRDAIGLYRNQRLRASAPSFTTTDPRGFSGEEREAIAAADRETHLETIK
jgi:hypothetical protein